MTPERKFYKSGMQHVFQISFDRGIIFYTDDDYVVFFTLLCCLAVKYGVRIVSFCIMKNHFHILGRFTSKETMELFLNALCSVFARKYNQRHHRRGQLFKKSFGNSPKYADDAIRDCLIYIYNNPIPKKATARAIEYRWNFLAYMDSKTPFSKPIDYSSLSEDIMSRMSVVNKLRGSGRYIDYNTFSTLVQGLDDGQYKQIIDHIISVYNIIDYSYILSKWKTKEAFTEILQMVTGSEFSSDEDISREDYRHYEMMNEVVLKAGFDLTKYRFDIEQTDVRLMSRLRALVKSKVCPSDLEMDKFFHSGEYSRRLSPKQP